MLLWARTQELHTMCGWGRGHSNRCKKEGRQADVWLEHRERTQRGRRKSRGEGTCPTPTSPRLFSGAATFVHWHTHPSPKQGLRRFLVALLRLRCYHSSHPARNSHGSTHCSSWKSPAALILSTVPHCLCAHAHRCLCPPRPYTRAGQGSRGRRRRNTNTHMNVNTRTLYTGDS